MKLLFDLFPLLLFFVAFKLQGIYVATVVAILATLIQIGWVAWRHRRVDPMLWLSLGIVVVFGGATLVLHDETFIKWKPTALYWAFAIGLVVAQMGFGKNPIEAMMQKQLTLPSPVWLRLNFAWAVFFALLGILNLFVAYNFTTDAWVNFKIFGTTGLVFVFVVAQSFWLGRYVRHD
ncbi:MAG: septation protein A [Janthinobacterium lividum]